MSREFEQFKMQNPQSFSAFPTRTTEDQLGANIWSWGERSPFYKGENALNYLSQGRLIKPLPDYQQEALIAGGFANLFQDIEKYLLEKPKNALLLMGQTSAIQQIEVLDGTLTSMAVGSNTDLPAGWYSKDSAFQIVKPNYNDDTLPRYTFRLKDFESDSILNSKFPDVSEMSFNILEQSLLAMNTFFTTLTGGLLSIDIIDPSDFGVWVLTATETVPLKTITTPESLLESIEFNDGKSKGLNLLPLALIGGGLLAGSIPLAVAGGGLYLLRR